MRLRKLLGDAGLCLAENREVDVHLGHGHCGGDRGEMNVIVSLRVKAIDKVGAIIHAGTVRGRG